MSTNENLDIKAIGQAILDGQAAAKQNSTGMGKDNLSVEESENTLTIRKEIPQAELKPEPGRVFTEEEKSKMNLGELVAYGLISKEEIKARFAQILERGVVNDRLFVSNLPADMYGEWCLNEQQSIDRMKMLGFVEDTQYATQNKLHSDGTGRAIVGDVIHMIAPKYVKDLYEEERRTRYHNMHNKKRGKGLAEEAPMTDLPVTNNSSSDPITGAELKKTL